MFVPLQHRIKQPSRTPIKCCGMLCVFLYVCMPACLPACVCVRVAGGWPAQHFGGCFIPTPFTTTLVRPLLCQWQLHEAQNMEQYMAWNWQQSRAKEGTILWQDVITIWLIGSGSRCQQRVLSQWLKRHDPWGTEDNEALLMNHRGRGEEVKPMNKSGDGNRGEKKMLKRTFMGDRGSSICKSVASPASWTLAQTMAF